MLTIEKTLDKKTWDNFLKEYNGIFPLFQTWQWGEVQNKLGFEVIRLGLFDNKKLIGIAQVIEIRAKRGHFFHIRQGPVLEKNEWKFFLKEVVDIAKGKNVDFIRLSPLIDAEEKIPLPSLTIPAPIHNMDAQICWVLDLNSNEEVILSQMRKSHRYLIKKALTMPIEIIRTTKTSELEKFLPLYKNLARQKHFVAHKGLKEELEVFGEENMGELFLAKYKGKIICGAMIDYVGDMAIYRHSASDEEHRDIPAMYLLQWEVIKEAKKRNKKIYNFWGIAENENKKHPWYGLSLFKKGFGGEKKEFMHAQDIILSPNYLKTFVIDYLTKLKKGY